MQVRPKNIAAAMEAGIGMGIRRVFQNVKYSDFTDGGAADGTLNLTKQLPVGAFVLGVKVTVKTGFTGNTTAVMSVGNADDANKYSDNTTVNVLAAGVVGESPEDPLEFIATATTVKLTITGASDYTLITAGEADVEVFYLSTVQEILDISM